TCFDRALRFLSRSTPERDQDVWPISGRFFTEHRVSTGSHPSYRHENPRIRTPAVRSPETVSNERGQAASGSTICSPSLAARFLSSLSRNRFERARSSRIGFENLKPELGGSFLEQSLSKRF